MSFILRGLTSILGLLILWQIVVTLFALPPYILPSPLLVLKTWVSESNLILQECIPTMIETILGLILGILIGCLSALLMVFIRPLAFWMLPLLVISQAIPTFAIAPLLVIWFGYGIASKIIVCVIMIFFPITSAFYDGLRKTNQDWLNLAQTMDAKKWRIFWKIRIPSALPFLASGIRVACVYAPIGAIIGEWVGASRGLGFLMLNANARMQIDLMFAALFTLVIFSLVLYFVIDKCLQWLIRW